MCFFWGTTYLGIKVALETVPPFLLGGIRFTLAGTILALGLRLMGHAWPDWRRAPTFLLIGIAMLGFGNGGVVWAEQFMASGLVAVLVASTPFWMVGIEIVGGGERLTRRTLTGLLIGFGGILLLVWPDLVAGDHRHVRLEVGRRARGPRSWPASAGRSVRRSRSSGCVTWTRLSPRRSRCWRAVS